MDSQNNPVASNGLAASIFRCHVDQNHRLVGDCVVAAQERGRVVLLHGGGQTRHSWKSTAALLAAQGWTTIAYDARGHGDSDWRRDGDYRLDGFAADLAAVIATFPGRVPVLVGASLGGMTALRYSALAGASPAGLVMVDIAPRMDDQEVERIHAFMAGNQDGFATLGAAQDAVQAYNPHRPRPASSDGLRRSMRQDAAGRWFWLWDPAILQNANEAARDAMTDDLMAAAERVRVPVLIVRGLRSQMVSDAAIAELAAIIPDVRHADIADAGHMVAGDDNDQFGGAVLAFLDDLDTADRGIRG